MLRAKVCRFSTDRRTRSTGISGRQGYPVDRQYRHLYQITVSGFSTVLLSSCLVHSRPYSILLYFYCRPGYTVLLQSYYFTSQLLPLLCSSVGYCINRHVLYCSTVVLQYCSTCCRCSFAGFLLPVAAATVSGGGAPQQRQQVLAAAAASAAPAVVLVVTLI